jgi:hypothetical protein
VRFIIVALKGRVHNESIHKGKGEAGMKRGDLWLAALLIMVVAALAVSRLLPGEASSDSGKRYAQITVGGEPYQTIELTGHADETIVIETNRGVNRLSIHDDGIEMHEADCPDQLCLSFGHITKRGDTIVCLPNRVLVEIIGGPDGGEVDVVVS